MQSKVGRKKLGEMSVIIYSQNLRGMNHDKEEELIQKLKAKKVWVALLQETWKPGHESYENQGFTFHCNGLPSRTPGRRGTQGVAIGLGREATRAWHRHA